MATLRVEGAHVVVELSFLEKLGALSRGYRAPLSMVSGVHVSDRPYQELRGLRVGTALPFVIVLGRMVYGEGTDFVAIYGTGRTVIVELAEGARYRRLFVSGASDQVVDQLRAAISARG